MNKILALLLTVFLSLGVALDAEAKEGWVLAVLSSDTPIYRKFIENYQKNLPADIKLSVVSGAEGLSGQTLGNHLDMILSVGSGAARQVRRNAPSVPVLYAMLLRQQYYAEIADSSRRDAAVFIDPPWRAQAELAKLVFPDLRSVGVVYTADSQPEVREIVREFKGKGIAVVSAKVDESGQAYEPIQEVLAKSDVLLAIQDSAIYNSNSIRNILLTSFRYGKPLIGLSAAYVRAGALYALSASPENMALDSALLSQSMLNSPTATFLESTRHYSIDVNRDVARTLGYNIRSDRYLEEALRADMERNR